MNDAAEIIEKALKAHMHAYEAWLWLAADDEAPEPMDFEFVIAALMGDADHVHLARQADGTITAVPMKFAPMRSCGAHPHRDCDEDPRNDCKWLTKWVDVDEVSS